MNTVIINTSKKNKRSHNLEELLFFINCQTHIFFFFFFGSFQFRSVYALMVSSYDMGFVIFLFKEWKVNLIFYLA